MFNVPKIVTINTGDQKVNFDKIPQTYPKYTNPFPYDVGKSHIFDNKGGLIWDLFLEKNFLKNRCKSKTFTQSLGLKKESTSWVIYYQLNI